ncbi:MAG: glutamate racemase [Candidatus Omnitrophica bacterium]|nr:glutamate racemase [Candidatus Omnitrophota bacterium]
MLSQDKESPIGVFDSGLGGLTVVKALMRQLPDEHIVYFGDTARVPYGTKSKASIKRFSLENAQILVNRNVKMIVVACNSSSSYALASLRKKFSLPIIGVVNPGAQAAVGMSTNNRIGVIATSATISSGVYVKAVKKINSSSCVFTQACPLFVPLVEEGWLQKKVTYDIALEYLDPLKRQRVDTLILGCTHYPLLKPVIEKVMGPAVCLVDSAEAVASQVQSILKRRKLARVSNNKRHCQFLISDKPQSFENTAKKFIGSDIKVNVLEQS